MQYYGNPFGSTVRQSEFRRVIAPQAREFGQRFGAVLPTVWDNGRYLIDASGDGVGDLRVRTLDWWQGFDFSDRVRVHVVPVYHWSRRRTFDRNKALWGGFVVTIDNFLRPWLVAGRAHIGALTVFIGVLGGISAFGPIGVFLGPLVLALAIALVRFALETS